MQATDILKSEHRVIEGVLEALSEAAEKLETGQVLRPGFFLDAAEFIKNFADGCHHRKEEGVLFKAMEAGGVPVQGGPIGVMLAEHEQGRAYTRAMRQAAEQLQAGNEAARQPLAQAARGYAALLYQHIMKEDNILFPMADRAIPASQHAQVLNDFENVEHDETGPGVHEKYLALAQALQDEVASIEQE
ncbi:MAG: hemerythrin domain-containing protein [Chloroflexota bacterium]